MAGKPVKTVALRPNAKGGGKQGVSARPSGRKSGKVAGY